MSINKFYQAGDTIVEVMIALAILGITLGAAFAASNRSQKSIQQAQEHTVALKQAETQVELLRSLADTAGTGGQIYTLPHLFCIDSNTSNLVVDNIKSAGTPHNMGMPALNSSGDNLTYGACVYSNGVNYNFAIDRCNPGSCGLPRPSTQYVFTVHVRWDSIQGNGHDEVSLSYKVDQ